MFQYRFNFKTKTKNLTTQQISASIELMNEIEAAKVTVKDAPKEIQNETSKETKIQKIYKICLLIQKIWAGITIFLLIIHGFLILQGGSWVKTEAITEGRITIITQKVNVFTSVVEFLWGVGAFTGVVTIIIGIIEYYLYFSNKTSNIDKIYGKKFLRSGIMFLILLFIVYFLSGLAIPREINIPY